jgi:hypothetical protein
LLACKATPVLFVAVKSPSTAPLPSSQICPQEMSAAERAECKARLPRSSSSQGRSTDRRQQIAADFCARCTSPTQFARRPIVCDGRECRYRCHAALLAPSPFPSETNVFGAPRQLARDNHQAAAARHEASMARAGCLRGVGLELMDARYLACLPLSQDRPTRWSQGLSALERGRNIT